MIIETAQGSDKPWQKTAGVLCLNHTGLRSALMRALQILSKPHERFLESPVLFTHKIVIAAKRKLIKNERERYHVRKSD